MLVRYDWKYLHTLVAFYLDQVLLDYEAQSAVEVSRTGLITSA